MWTKGNKNGEWEASISKDGYQIIGFKQAWYGEHIWASTDHSDETPEIRFENRSDVRLVELAPRMAEALLKQFDYLYRQDQHDVKLYEELMKLKNENETR